MRVFMAPDRIWQKPGASQADRGRPHVLWTMQDHPHVLGYFREIRQILAPYTDIVTPIAEDDLHWTIQGAHAVDIAGDRVGAPQLATAAKAIGHELSGIQPFEVTIGPAALSRSAVMVRVLPRTPGRDVFADLSTAVRTGLTAAGLTMPAAPKIPHASAAYGAADTYNDPQLARHCDDLASVLIHEARHEVTVTVDTLHLVMETQDVAGNTYHFDRVHDLPLGQR
ncbi:2'-5' RNA ligase family protein [Streptomyces sp. NPDC050085]|uniref:2'-5' RNA ligase family protein n=1 Tax=Streptomyces sp. NPDC050085 TaxID=3365600 RepID=UPI00379D99AF